jgi:hypothetical protein
VMGEGCSDSAKILKSRMMLYSSHGKRFEGSG